MTEPAPAESALEPRSSSPWLLASIGSAAVIMGFSWFGGFISWHDAISPPFDGAPSLTLSTFKPHGTKAAHAVWVLSDRALCIGPYSAATWTALRAAALGAAILGSLIAFRGVLGRMAGCTPDRAAWMTAREARRMLAWWVLPLVGLFAAGTLITLDSLRLWGLLWVGLMSVAWLPWRMARAARRTGLGSALGPTLVQALIGIACLVAAVLAGGALVAPPA
ncbi:MAG: hypothetical protein QM519_09525 [Bacteroidia bacterium]|nr:hypothetical protein [Bacteroidia bacterium]